MNYELVTTTYLPGQANAAAQAAAAAEHTSGLVGYWLTEIGTLNQTVELWSGPRPAPGGEPGLEQTVYPLAGVVGPTAPAATGGVYELRHYLLRHGVVADWTGIFTAALPAREKYSPIVGLFANDAADRVVHIWNYPDLNTRAAARGAALHDPVWQDFLAKSRGGRMVVRQDVAILLPAKHSPLA